MKPELLKLLAITSILGLLAQACGRIPNPIISAQERFAAAKASLCSGIIYPPSQCYVPGYDPLKLPDPFEEAQKSYGAFAEAQGLPPISDQMIQLVEIIRLGGDVFRSLGQAVPGVYAPQEGSPEGTTFEVGADFTHLDIPDQRRIIPEQIDAARSLDQHVEIEVGSGHFFIPCSTGLCIKTDLVAQPSLDLETPIPHGFEGYSTWFTVDFDQIVDDIGTRQVDRVTTVMPFPQLVSNPDPNIIPSTDVRNIADKSMQILTPGGDFIAVLNPLLDQSFNPTGNMTNRKLIESLQEYTASHGGTWEIGYLDEMIARYPGDLFFKNIQSEFTRPELYPFTLVARWIAP